MPRLRTQPAIHPFDQLHGTDTSGLIPGSVIARGTTADPAELTAYYGVAPSILYTLLDIWLQRTAPLAPIEQTVFLDVGAGKGRALLLASRFPFRRAEGIELNPELAAIAQANINLWQRDPTADALTPLVLHHADAIKHPLPDAPTVALHPHPFDLLYANAEHGSLLDRHPAFTRLWMGSVPMSPADHLADLAAIAQQKEYGSTGDELCAIYRHTGRGTKSRR